MLPPLKPPVRILHIHNMTNYLLDKHLILKFFLGSKKFVLF